MEILLEDLLTKIHSKNFSEPKQISDELERLILSDKLTKDQVSYCSSKIFNSDYNFFNFLNLNATDKDKQIVNLRKEIFDILTYYIKINHSSLINYLPMIRDSCLTIFKKEISQKVKEISIKPIQVIIDLYDADLLKPILLIQPLANVFLDEYRHMKPQAGVKGMIWSIVGAMTRKFPEEMADYRLEIEELIFYNIKKQMEDSRTIELKALEGMFTGLR